VHWPNRSPAQSLFVSLIDQLTLRDATVRVPYGGIGEFPACLRSIARHKLSALAVVDLVRERTTVGPPFDRARVRQGDDTKFSEPNGRCHDPEV